MPIRKGSAVWEGNLKSGAGRMRTATGACEGAYSAASRFEEGEGTNPEELIGAAHAGCFSMALSLLLEQAGFNAERIETTARVYIEKRNAGHAITWIELETQARVPKIPEEVFQERAEAAKKGCPVSQALKGTEITLRARLVS